VLFNQQVAAITLDHGGHGDTGFPSVGHEPIVTLARLGLAERGRRQCRVSYSP
jgi:hypothetical protein